jgi:hypothetical protein
MSWVKVRPRPQRRARELEFPSLAVQRVGFLRASVSPRWGLDLWSRSAVMRSATSHQKLESPKGADIRLFVFPGKVRFL